MLSAIGGLATVILGAAQFDPDWSIAQMEQPWAAHDPSMTKDSMPSIIYYLAHENRALGQIDMGAHTSIPTSTVFNNARTKKRTAVIYNPKAAARTATLYRGSVAVGTAAMP